MTVKEELLKTLDQGQCEDCPLKKICNLSVVIYDESLCDELRNENE